MQGPKLVQVTSIPEAPVPLERDVFLRTLIRELSGILEDVIGLQEASGFMSVVGQTMGNWINREYKAALNLEILTPAQVAEVLVDLKRRINGDFFVIEQDEEKIVFGNRRCPFGEKVIGRESMCMMTSNVFGAIAADNLGYAKVELQQAIARGDAGCRVVVYITQNARADAANGREYFNSK